MGDQITSLIPGYGQGMALGQYGAQNSQGMGGAAWGQILGPIIGAGMGLALEDHNDYRQQRQAQELGQIQVGLTEQLQNHSMELQQQMWNNTSYPAQVAMMEKAGLNPAMMYAKGGPGGVTGSPSGSVSGQSAQQNPGEAMQGAGMGLQTAAQLRLLSAQAANIEADTKLKQVDADKKAGVDTQNVAADTNLKNTQIASLNKGIEGTDAEIKMKQAQTALTELNTNILQATKPFTIQEAGAKAVEAMQLAHQAVNNSDISDATKQDKIQIANAEAIRGFLTNALVNAEITNTKSDTNLKNEQIQGIKKEIDYKSQQITNLANDITMRTKEYNLDDAKAALQGLIDIQKLDQNQKQQYIEIFRSILTAGAIAATK